ncbi:MAG TPA: TonB-dependent receptor, partial [Vicinamibacterales bacterium]|nr:TonB-dependent receptor [Vicinamibacterales bacterium]
FAQSWMSGTISSNAADFAYHLYRNGDQRMGYVFRNEWDISPHNTLIFGSQYEHGYEISQEYWGPTVGFQPLDTYNDAWNQPGYRNSTTEYVEDKYHAGKLLLNPGIRFNQVQTADYTPAVGYFYSFPFAVGNAYGFTEPSLGVRYAFNPHLTAYGGIGSSAKPPEIAAYYNDSQFIPGTGQIAPLIVQPERSIDLDAGLRGQLRGMYWAVDVYNDRFTNTFLTAPADASYFEGLGQTPAQAAASAASNSITLTTNGGDAVYHGVELSLTHVPLGVTGRILGYVNFSQNSAVYTTPFPNGSGATVPVGTNVPYVPNELWNVGIYHRGGAVDWRLGEHYVGAQTIFDNVAGGPSSTTLAAYGSVDGYVSFKLDRSGEYRVNLTGTNLLDNQGYVYGYISSAFTDANGNTLPLEVVMPQAPRAFYVSIAGHFR